MRVRASPGGWLGRARLLAAIALIAVIAAGAVGQFVRDRSAAWGLLLYLPLFPLGLAALGLDLLARGRSVPGGRFLLGGVGLVAVVGGSIPLLGFGPGGGDPGDRDEVSVLHWNVIWGGGRVMATDRWEKIRRTILDHPTDVVILSEGPPDGPLDGLVGAMGPGASRVQVENGPDAVRGYWFKLVVASRWPVRALGRIPVVNGAAMAAEVTVRGRPIRILVVDGLSHPRLHRAPFLRSVAEACEAAKKAGEPFDLVAGDFNCVGRSLGFDGLDRAGYDLAARRSRGWRATFPSFAPIYDIDHVWVRNYADRLRCAFFTDLASDHRGQVVRFRLPSSPRLAVQFQHPVVAHLLGLGDELPAGRFEVGGQRPLRDRFEHAQGVDRALLLADQDLGQPEPDPGRGLHGPLEVILHDGHRPAPVLRRGQELDQ
ncbi:endonuclease/exonuclease/phosphatase family protein [Tundrisphaera sp. TA3]|uniref:endonuclease/exonuclease/phosphatase family protein n=1 Tax=Tundrisphaera sp. TA3 TaxID=3435775 RepID=UPI003EBB1EF4